MQGTIPINYQDFFDKVGLKVKAKKVETSYVQNAGSLIVAGNQESGTIFFTDLVTKNSFWADNGVQPNDEIIEVNGTKVTLANANSVLTASFQWKEGDDLSVKLSRGGKEVVINTKITKSYTEGSTLTTADNSTKDQLAIREAWLKG